MAQEKNQKIILFLSTPNPNAKQVDYDCPGDSTVSGVQTYDAPIKYLLSTHRAVSEILCIVTSDAKEQSWGRFEKELVPEALREAKRKEEDVVCTPIAFPENASIKEVLPDILNRTHEGDKILLETTGGLRNAMMYLLLISRALSYKKVNTTCAVYSNYQPKKGIFRVEDVTDMLQVFDLIDGMQNLTSFGNVAALRRYYKNRDHSEKIDNLLNAVDELWGCITLCRSNQVPDKLEAFNKALKGAAECGDPLLEALLPAFRDKFGDEMTIPTLILWCVDSDMIQQALTLYRECIPAYVMDEQHNYLTVKENTDAASCSKKDYKSVEEARFCKCFLNIGRKSGKNYIETLSDFERVLQQSDFEAKCPINQLRDIFMDYLYIRILRNMANHANEKPSESKRALLHYLKDEGYKDMNDSNDPIKVEDVKAVIRTALKHLE